MNSYLMILGLKDGCVTSLGYVERCSTLLAPNLLDLKCKNHFAPNTFASTENNRPPTDYQSNSHGAGRWNRVHGLPCQAASANETTLLPSVTTPNLSTFFCSSILLHYSLPGADASLLSLWTAIFPVNSKGLPGQYTFSSWLPLQPCFSLLITSWIALIIPQTCRRGLWA